MKKGILIKYGEIVLKGNNRAQFENVLIKDIHIALKGMGESAIRKEQGRLYISLPDNITDEKEGEEWIREACEKLTYVFGILRICPVDVLDEDQIDFLGRKMAEYVKREFDEPHTFKVICKRANKHYPMNSMEVAAEVGAIVLDEVPSWTVNVHEPEVTLFVELRNQVYIYGKEIKGQGGLPVGTGGKCALLLSGGIDSPVAGWMMARRGIRLCAVYFHAHPYTSERAKEKVLELARLVSRYAGPIPVYVIPFTEIQLAIYEKCHHEKLTIIMRRMMMLIAEKIAEKEGADSLITGENVGQVASQTLASMYCTNAVCHMPVYRPVIAFDKQEIVEIARKIDTFETSILPYEDCCTIFVAKHPTTQPKLADIEEDEKKLYPEVVDQIETAVRDAELYIAHPDRIRKASVQTTGNDESE